MESSRFLILHTRPAAPVDAAQHEAMRQALGPFRQELASAGVLRDLVVLDPGAEGARVVFEEGEVARVDRGSFDESQTLTAFCTIEAASRQEALAWLSRWPMQPEVDERVELRDSGCPGGVMAIMPAPPATPDEPAVRRYAVLLRANAQLDAEVLAPPSRLQAMTRRNEDGTARGVLVAGEGLKGSARATRRHVRHGVSHLVDGPYTEIKEMVAGYWIVQVPALQDAIEWVRHYPYPFDDVVVDLRAVDSRPLPLPRAGAQADAHHEDTVAIAQPAR